MSDGAAGAERRWARALVTGASSGIGRALARALAARGTDLVITARDGERLQALAVELAGGPSEAEPGVQVEVLVADLSDRADQARVAERLVAEDHPIDLLVNNAGFGFSGEVITLDPEAERSVVEVNVAALHHLSQLAATTMAGRGGGGILNVSSIAGSGPAPRAATYAATKAFVTSYSQALHAEVAPLGVVVCCLCPGLTRTEFQQRAGSRTDDTPDFLWQTAETVAEAGLAGLERGRVVVVPGAHNKVLSAGIKAAPLGLIHGVRNRFRG